MVNRKDHRLAARQRHDLAARLRKASSRSYNAASARQSPGSSSFRVAKPRASREASTAAQSAWRASSDLVALMPRRSAAAARSATRLLRLQGKRDAEHAD